MGPGKSSSLVPTAPKTESGSRFRDCVGVQRMGQPKDTNKGENGPGGRRGRRQPQPRGRRGAAHSIDSLSPHDYSALKNVHAVLVRAVLAAAGRRRGLHGRQPEGSLALRLADRRVHRSEHPIVLVDELLHDDAGLSVEETRVGEDGQVHAPQRVVQVVQHCWRQVGDDALVKHLVELLLVELDVLAELHGKDGLFLCLLIVGHLLRRGHLLGARREEDFCAIAVAHESFDQFALLSFAVCVEKLGLDL